MELLNDNRNDEEERLIQQIELEMRKIYASVEKIYNNQALTDVSDPFEKCLRNNYSFSACLLDRANEDEQNSNEDSLKLFTSGLQKELDNLAADLDQLVNNINESNEWSSGLDNKIAVLNEMMEVNKNHSSPKKNVAHITKNIKMRFKKEKSELKAIITSLFADNLDVQDLIARIIEHHFNEGSDKYLQLENEDNITEQIEFLRRTNLFDINPHDILQIRLTDLI